MVFFKDGVGEGVILFLELLPEGIGYPLANASLTGYSVPSSSCLECEIMWAKKIARIASMPLSVSN